jgi:hypothetical protein
MSTVRKKVPEQPQGTPRDLSVSALILGFAAMMWFGWGHAQPPPEWSIPLTIGLFAAIAVGVFPESRGAGFRGSPPPMRDQRVSRRYGITVGAEVTAIALGVLALGLAGRPAYTAPWILLVVGVHFVPLGRLFGSVDLVWSGLALCAVAIAAAVTGAVSAVAPSAVTGGFGGLVLVVTAVASLCRAALHDRPASVREADG